MPPFEHAPLAITGIMNTNWHGLCVLWCIRVLRVNQLLLHRPRLDLFTLALEALGALEEALEEALG